eukprot:15722554-Heterocapsa_arctica.AAC.1
MGRSDATLWPKGSHTDTMTPFSNRPESGDKNDHTRQAWHSRSENVCQESCSTGTHTIYAFLTRI